MACTKFLSRITLNKRSTATRVFYKKEVGLTASCPLDMSTVERHHTTTTKKKNVSWSKEWAWKEGEEETVKAKKIAFRKRRTKLKRAKMTRTAEAQYVWNMKKAKYMYAILMSKDQQTIGKLLKICRDGEQARTLMSMVLPSFHVSVDLADMTKSLEAFRALQYTEAEASQGTEGETLKDFTDDMKKSLEAYQGLQGTEGETLEDGGDGKKKQKMLKWDLWAPFDCYAEPPKAEESKEKPPSQPTDLTLSASVLVALLKRPPIAGEFGPPSWFFEEENQSHLTPAGSSDDGYVNSLAELQEMMKNKSGEAQCWLVNYAHHANPGKPHEALTELWRNFNKDATLPDDVGSEGSSSAGSSLTDSPPGSGKTAHGARGGMKNDD